jgi:predicted  nucleic acid-binding Zn-ribbon protein
MATNAFGIDPSLLIVDEAELARLRATSPVFDTRQAGNLSAELSNKQHRLNALEADLTQTSHGVVDLTGALVKMEKGVKKLEKTSGGVSVKIVTQCDHVRDELKHAKAAEAQLTRRVEAQKVDIKRFLSEGSPSNGEIISEDNERDKVLAGL